MTENARAYVGRRQSYSVELARYLKYPQVKGSLTVVLSIFLIIIFLIFAIQPTIAKIAELRTEIAESEKILQQLKSKSQVLGSIAAQWEETRLKLPALRRSLPMGPDYRVLNKELMVLANQQGVELLNMNINEALMYERVFGGYLPTRKMSVVPMQVTMRLGGDYEQLMSFFEALIGVDRVLQIESLSLAPEVMTNKENKHPLSLNITGRVFYMADVDQLSKIIDTSGKSSK